MGWEFLSSDDSDMKDNAVADNDQITGSGYNSLEGKLFYQITFLCQPAPGQFLFFLN
ncbi:MAG: hypothetical protein ABIN24_08835 [Dyadobacter sp.]